MNILNGFLLCCFFSLFSFDVFSQSSLSDSEIVARSRKAVIDQYALATGDISPLYNGSEYVNIKYGISNNPFFTTVQLTPGSVWYDGQLYQVPLIYDILQDEVVINYYNENYKIRLVNDKVREFSVFGHTFIHLFPDSSFTDQPAAGFYDRLYNRKLVVYVKRKKLLKERTSSETTDPVIFEKTYPYIFKDRRFYPIQSKSALLNVFGNRKKEVQKLLRTNKIKYRKNPELAIVKGAEFYDQLTH
jgi:hypothetical protein